MSRRPRLSLLCFYLSVISTTSSAHNDDDDDKDYDNDDDDKNYDDDDDCGLWTVDCGLGTGDCGLGTGDCGVWTAAGVRRQTSRVIPPAFAAPSVSVNGFTGLVLAFLRCRNIDEVFTL